jgi:anti-anti-sigma factor
MSAVLEASVRHDYVLAVEGPLQVPHTGRLTRRVRALVCDGERRIVLDLARVPSIDAAGIGELMDVYGRVAALDGALRIAHAGARVREPLERAGLFDLLSAPARAARTPRVRPRG